MVGRRGGHPRHLQLAKGRQNPTFITSCGFYKAIMSLGAAKNIPRVTQRSPNGVLAVIATPLIHASSALSLPTHADRLIYLALAIRLAVGHQTLDLGAQVRILDRQPKALRPVPENIRPLRLAAQDTALSRRRSRVRIPQGLPVKTISASRPAGRSFSFVGPVSDYRIGPCHLAWRPPHRRGWFQTSPPGSDDANPFGHPSVAIGYAEGGFEEPVSKVAIILGEEYSGQRSSRHLEVTGYAASTTEP